MIYFLTVTSITGEKLRWNERHESLNSALQAVSENYLVDASHPWRWSGYFKIHAGKIDKLMIRSTTARPWLRDDIQTIEIVSVRNFLDAAATSALSTEEVQDVE